MKEFHHDIDAYLLFKYGMQCEVYMDVLSMLTVEIRMRIERKNIRLSEEHSLMVQAIETSTAKRIRKAFSDLIFLRGEIQLRLTY